MLAQFFRDSSHAAPSDVEQLVPLLEARAVSAYEYAKAMVDREGDASICSDSVANHNCIGAACDDDWYSVRPSPSLMAQHCDKHTQRLHTQMHDMCIRGAPVKATLLHHRLQVYQLASDCRHNMQPCEPSCM